MQSLPHETLQSHRDDRAFAALSREYRDKVYEVFSSSRDVYIRLQDIDERVTRPASISVELCLSILHADSERFTVLDFDSSLIRVFATDKGLVIFSLCPYFSVNVFFICFFLISIPLMLNSLFK